MSSINEIKSNFDHQGKTNSKGSYDVDAELKNKSTKELDALIAKYSSASSQQMKDYVAKIKLERAKRVGVKKESLFRDMIDMLVEEDTPGLNLGAFKYDDTKKVIYAVIGGKKYVFTPHIADKAAQVFASVTGMAKHSTGRALAYLKKNATGQKLNEALDVKWDHPTKQGYTYDPEISDDITAGFSNDDGEQTYVKRATLPAGHPAKSAKVSESAEKKLDSLKTIEAILDGKLPLTPSTWSSEDKRKLMAQRSLLIRENGKSLFYVTIYDNEDTQYASVEAYVVVDDKTGKLSYHDEDGEHDVYIDSKYIGKGGRTTSEKINDVVDKFKLESGHATKGAIDALLSALGDK